MYCQRKLFNKKRQVVVLLGAGAATAWGGVTSEDIKTSFINDRRIMHNGTTISQYIFNILNEFYNPNCANFETFLAALEETLSYVLSSTNEGRNEFNTSFIPAIFKLDERMDALLVNKTDKRQYCYEIFRTYVNLLIDKINEYNCQVSGKHELNKNLVRFTKYFLNRNYSVKYYTTNYDSIIPQVLSESCNIYEGLHNHSYDGYKRFNPDLGLFRKARLSHFNLHGSIFLYQEIVDKGRGYEVVYGKEKKLPETALQENGGNPNERLLFSPIIAGYKKTQHAANQPFSLGFNAFTNDCNDCDALCIVGYSASDPHINTILSSYINWSKVKFVYVTNGDNGLGLEKLKANIVQISEKNFDSTWMHDGKKHVYKLGFEKFLEDKSNWRYLHDN
jgi:hypothetical protein